MPGRLTPPHALSLPQLYTAQLAGSLAALNIRAQVSGAWVPKNFGGRQLWAYGTPARTPPARRPAAALEKNVSSSEEEKCVAAMQACLAADVAQPASTRPLARWIHIPHRCRPV